MATRITDLVTLPDVESTFYRVKQCVTFLVVALIIYATWVFLPVCVTSYKFEEVIQSTARSAAYNEKDENHILSDIMEQARQIGVPVKEENVHVIRDENIVRISASYDLPVHLLRGKVINLTFSPSSAEKTLSHAAIQAKEAAEGK